MFPGQRIWRQAASTEDVDKDVHKVARGFVRPQQKCRTRAPSMRKRPWQRRHLGNPRVSSNRESFLPGETRRITVGTVSGEPERRNSWFEHFHSWQIIRGNTGVRLLLCLAVFIVKWPCRWPTCMNKQISCDNPKVYLVFIFRWKMQNYVKAHSSHMFSLINNVCLLLTIICLS